MFSYAVLIKTKKFAVGNMFWNTRKNQLLTFHLFICIVIEDWKMRVDKWFSHDNGDDAYIIKNCITNRHNIMRLINDELIVRYALPVSCILSAVFAISDIELVTLLADQLLCRINNYYNFLRQQRLKNIFSILLLS